eukprot:7123296-Pyramimonas_sp.AAC.1
MQRPTKGENQVFQLEIQGVFSSTLLVRLQPPMLTPHLERIHQGLDQYDTPCPSTTSEVQSAEVHRMIRGDAIGPQL